MASFKGYDRARGAKAAPGPEETAAAGNPRDRVSREPAVVDGQYDMPIPAPLWTPTDTNLLDAQNGPMANLGTEAVGIYKAYLDSGGNTSQLAAEFPTIEFQNGMVGVDGEESGGRFQPVRDPAHRRGHADHGDEHD